MALNCKLSESVDSWVFVSPKAVEEAEEDVSFSHGSVVAFLADPSRPLSSHQGLAL